VSLRNLKKKKISVDFRDIILKVFSIREKTATFDQKPPWAKKTRISPNPARFFIIKIKEFFI